MSLCVTETRVYGVLAYVMHEHNHTKPDAIKLKKMVPKFYRFRSVYICVCFDFPKNEVEGLARHRPPREK